MSEPTTIVVFRVFKQGGDVIALFPEVPWDYQLCASYQSQGQHGGASLGLVYNTVPAKPHQYAALKRELELMGYRLDVRQRITPKMRENRRKFWNASSSIEPEKE